MSSRAPDHQDVVLIVDDSPETLRFLTDALDERGMTVMVALDGQAALRVIARITPDIVLLDAIMPGIDGFETCRSIKAIGAMREVPIVFMTGLTETEHIVEGLAAGAVDYVTKPIKLDELLARMDVHLANAKLGRSARLALDAAGRHLLAIDRSGRVLWSTPEAGKLIASASASGNESLSLGQDLVDTLLAHISESSPSASVPLPRNSLLQVSYVGQIGPNEILLRIQAQQSRPTSGKLRETFGLTGREAEVLTWIAEGKSNRDIAAILKLSPRTVDKHLEQIYAKLKVENRTAAAAIALRLVDAS